MPSVQTMLEIAMRYATSMADAMILACYTKAQEDGFGLTLPGARARLEHWSSAGTVDAPAEDVDWEQMVMANSDTAHLHC